MQRGRHANLHRRCLPGVSPETPARKSDHGRQRSRRVEGGPHIYPVAYNRVRGSHIGEELLELVRGGMNIHRPEYNLRA
ncbi:hypothetical protein M413DRAFT_138346 [Hebeloma cylindrosporum]|uniref:Uncharacterized protein n=1 Tax=Hebeloma cylindrosporum TaxID=76867 RepID=A0A0C3CDX0_HEBCY|nr:hypothetical protein M413DRAFT_138346 [Hebeloma cylindrosporum h7]